MAGEIERKIKAELEIIRQMSDHDLLVRLTEKVIFMTASLEVTTKRINIVENRLWTAIFALAAAAVGTIVKVFWKSS